MGVVGEGAIHERQLAGAGSNGRTIRYDEVGTCQEKLAARALTPSARFPSGAPGVISPASSGNAIAALVRESRCACAVRSRVHDADSVADTRP